MNLEEMCMSIQLKTKMFCYGMFRGIEKESLRSRTEKCKGPEGIMERSV